jgi:hypothetical protein
MSTAREVLMEICLLLLPVAVLLALGWTQFPAMTAVFVVYLAAFGIRAAYRMAKRSDVTSLRNV